MDTNQLTPAKTRAWYAGLGEAWERVRRAIFVWERTGNRSAEKALLVVVLLLVVAFGLGRWTAPVPTPEPDVHAAATGQLQAELGVLKLQVSLLTPAEQPSTAAEQVAPEPDPQPPRTSAPRAALRPAQGTNPPAAAPTGWGTTDLDRAIAAFPSTHLEQAK